MFQQGSQPGVALATKGCDSLHQNAGYTPPQTGGGLVTSHLYQWPWRQNQCRRLKTRESRWDKSPWARFPGTVPGYPGPGVPAKPQSPQRSFWGLFGSACSGRSLAKADAIASGHILYILLNVCVFLKWGQKEREGNDVRNTSH